MIVAHSRSFVFVHTTKTAGEAITGALLPSLTTNDIVLTNGPITEMRRRILPRYRDLSGLRKHSAAMEIKSAIGAERWNQYFSFAVVRDPVARVTSLYRYLQKERSRLASSATRRLWYGTPFGRAADPRNWPGMRALNDTSSFSEFLRHPEVVRARGLRPQVEMVSDAAGNVIVSRVVRMENLNHELAEVWPRLGLQWPGSIEARNSTAKSSMQVDVSEADRKLIADRYEEDYMAFQY